VASRRSPLLTAFVVDASVAAGWLLPDERNEIADALAFRMQSEDALAPDLFWREARSLLVTESTPRAISTDCACSNTETSRFRQ
jgi:hypothetical protein